MLHSCERDKIKDLESFPCVAFASGVSQLQDTVYVKQAMVRLENLNELIRDRGKHYAGLNPRECWEEAGRYPFGKITEDLDVGFGWGELSTVKSRAEQSNISSRKFTVMENKPRSKPASSQENAEERESARAQRLRTGLWMWRTSQRWNLWTDLL